VRQKHLNHWVYLTRVAHCPKCGRRGQGMARWTKREGGVHWCGPYFYVLHSDCIGCPRSPRLSCYFGKIPPRPLTATDKEKLAKREPKSPTP